MLIVIDQYDTQEVYVNPDLTGKSASKIISHIEG